MFDTSSSEPSAMTLLLLAEIGLPHFGVGPDRLRRAGRDDAAIDQDRDAIGQREYRLHIVLDQQNREFALELAQRPDHARALIRPHPGHRLLHPGPARRPGKSHPPLQLARLPPPPPFARPARPPP